MFQRLVAYKQQHGDCNTPYSYPDDKPLGRWVCDQRFTLKNAPLDDPRRSKLDSIGFTWVVKGGRADWHEMFERLVAHRKVHGYHNFGTDRQLGKWVDNQARRLANAPLDDARRMKLDSIGFTWKGEGRQKGTATRDDDESQRSLTCSYSDEENCHVWGQETESSGMSMTKQQRQKDAPDNDEKRRALETIGFRFQDETDLLLTAPSGTPNYRMGGQARSWLVEGISGVYFRESF